MTRRRLGLRCLQCLCLAALAAVLAGVRPAVAQEASPAPTAAGLDISVTPSRTSVGRDEPVDLFLVVGNPSASPVGDLHTRLENDDFELVKGPSFPPLLPGYGGAEGRARIMARPTAHFTSEQVLLVFTYTWSNAGQLVTAVQGSAVALDVKRRFDEETSGLLGGNAAFFYLLLPIIPLFLGFQVVNQLAKTAALSLPSFRAEWVVPAFLVAVLLNLALIIVLNQLVLDYSDPLTMFLILVGSLAVGGAAAAAVRLRLLRLLPWRYRQSDSETEYLRKVLLRPGAAADHEWATATDARGETWEGVLLDQPGAGPVLGATYGVSAEADRQDDLDALFNADGSLKSDRRSRTKLIDLLRSNAVSVAPVNNIKAGPSLRQDIAVLTEVDIQRVSTKPCVLVRRV